MNDMKIPEGWQSEELEYSLISLPKSKHPSGISDENGYYNFYVCSPDIQKSFQYDVNEPAILFSTGGEAAIHYATGKYSFSTDVWATKFSGNLTNEFVFRFLDLNKNKINNLGFQGSGIKHLDKDFIKKLNISFPPLAEQKKIASILTSVDEVIEKTQSQIKKLQDLKKGTMNELLTNGIDHTEFKDSELGRIPKSWEVAPLSDHASKVLSKNDIGNTNVLTASAIYGLINQKQYFNKLVSSSDISHYTLLRRGDFAYNKSYSNGYPVGVVRQLEKYDLGVLSPLYICFSITSNECDNTYLSYYFNSYIFERELNLVVQEGARAHGLLNIPVNDFFDRKLLIPNLTEQKKIVSILNSIDNHIDQKKQTLNKKQSLKKSLMQDLLTGKVRVTVN